MSSKGDFRGDKTLGGNWDSCGDSTNPDCGEIINSSNILQFQGVQYKIFKNGDKCLLSTIQQQEPHDNKLQKSKYDDIVVVPMQQQRQGQGQGREEVVRQGQGEVVVVVQQRTKQQSQQLASQNDKDRVITMKNLRGRGQGQKGEQVVGARKQVVSQTALDKSAKSETKQGRSTTQAAKIVSKRRSDSTPSPKKHEHIILIENAWTSRSHLSSSLADKKPQQLPPLTSEEAFPPPAVTRSSSEYTRLQSRSQSTLMRPVLGANQSVWPLPSSSSSSLSSLGAKSNSHVPKQILRCGSQPYTQSQAQMQLQAAVKPVNTPFANSPQSPQFDEPFAEFVSKKQQQVAVVRTAMTHHSQPRSQDSEQHQGVQTFKQPTQLFKDSPQMMSPSNQGQTPYGYPFTECINFIKIRRLQASLQALMNIGYDIQTARSAVQFFGEDLQSSLEWLQGGCQQVHILEAPTLNIDWEITRMRELVQRGAFVDQVVNAVKMANGDVVAASEVLFPSHYIQGQRLVSGVVSSSVQHGEMPKLNVSPPLYEEQDEGTYLLNCLDSYCLSDTSLISPLDVNASITSDDSFTESFNVAKGSRFLSFFRRNVTNENHHLSEIISLSSFQPPLDNDDTYKDDNFSSNDQFNYILDSLEDSNCEFGQVLETPQSTEVMQTTKVYDYGLPESLYDDCEGSDFHGNQVVKKVSFVVVD